MFINTRSYISLLILLSAIMLAGCNTQKEKLITEHNKDVPVFHSKDISNGCEQKTRDFSFPSIMEGRRYNIILASGQIFNGVTPKSTKIQLVICKDAD